MHIFIFFSKQLKILTELGYFNINGLEIDTDDTKTRLDVSAKKKNTKKGPHGSINIQKNVLFHL